MLLRCLLLLAALAVSPTAWAGVQRFAVVAGNNDGSQGTLPLVFAELDAVKVHGLLTGPGEVGDDHAELLLGGTRNDLLGALVGLRGDVALARERGHETVVVFYYSGHADEKRLQLGRTWVTYDELADLLERTGADVRVAFVDACQSGAMAGGADRRKGGTRAPSFVFDLTERLEIAGQVVITSSAGDEASQESDEIGGSYFTHYLASGLSGAADANRDGLVTLSETYDYVYRETVFHTARSATGVQHPSRAYDLAGQGELVLSNLGTARATLVFPTAVPGRYAVFDRNRKQYVAEVSVVGEEQRLHLRPGTYLVQERYPTHLQVAQVDLRDGATVSLDGAAFAAVEYEDDLAKGVIDKTIRRSQLPDLSIRILSGGRGMVDPEIASAYLPNTLAAGAGATFHWRSGKWMSADIVSGSGAGNLTIDGLPYTVPVRVTGTTFGLAAGFETRPRVVAAGAGLRLAGTSFVRRFSDEDVPDQQLFTVAPGFVLWAGVHPGRFEIDLELRHHYLPYIIDDLDTGVRFNEVVFGLGYRF